MGFNKIIALKRKAPAPGLTCCVSEARALRLAGP